MINACVFVYRVSRGKTNPLASNWMQYLGFLAVVVGNVGEIVIERGRRAFKNDKRNAGKVYDQGESRSLGPWSFYVCRCRDSHADETSTLHWQAPGESSVTPTMPSTRSTASEPPSPP